MTPSHSDASLDTTITERIIADRGDAVGDRSASQAIATPERTIADASDGLGINLGLTDCIPGALRDRHRVSHHDVSEQPKLLGGHRHEGEALENEAGLERRQNVPFHG